MTNPLNFEEMQKNRYKYFGAYKVDRWIIQVCMFLCFAFLFYVAWHYDFNLDYYSCESPYNDYSRGLTLNGITNDTLHQCKNRFYTPVTWKNSEYLPPGEYGTKPGALFNSIWYVTLGIFIIGFAINHFIHNKKNVFGGRAE